MSIIVFLRPRPRAFPHERLRVFSTMLPLLLVLVALPPTLDGALFPDVHVEGDDGGDKVVGLVPPRGGEADGVVEVVAGVGVVLQRVPLCPRPDEPGKQII